MLFAKNEKKEIERIKTFIPDLDKALAGGIPINSTVLIAGESGTMKTTLCFHILYNNALEGKKCVYFTLEETSQSIMQQMGSMGYDLDKVKIQVVPDTNSLFIEVGHLNKDNADIIIIDIGNIRHEIATLSKQKYTSHDWLATIEKSLITLKKAELIDIVVLDSLSAIYSLSSFENPRKEIFQAFGFFKKLKITTFFISEIPPEENRYSEFGVEDYLADGIIRMRNQRRELKVLGMINIVKMRSTPANKDLFLYEYENNSFKLYKKLD